MQLLLKTFEKHGVQFVEFKDELWLSTTQIANALDLPRNSLNHIYLRNYEILDDYSTKLNLPDPQGILRSTRVFNETGVLMLALLSRSKQAVPFQKWVAQVIDSIRKKGYYISPSRAKTIHELVQQEVRQEVRRVQTKTVQLPLIGTRQPPHCKPCFEKTFRLYNEGMSYEAIAAFLSIKESTVRSYVYKYRAWQKNAER